jgi:hypothetical protein
MCHLTKAYSNYVSPFSLGHGVAFDAEHLNQASANTITIWVSLSKNGPNVMRRVNGKLDEQQCLSLLAELVPSRFSKRPHSGLLAVRL